MVLKAIVFDFDGVIAESMDLKSEAFAYVFRDCSKDVIEKVVKLHRDNGGMTRFEKFRIAYRDFLRRELTKAREEQLGKEFSDYVFDRTVKCPYVSGAKEFIEKNYKKYKLFVASGIPHQEINQIIDARGLQQYFIGVWGIPGPVGKNKGDILKMILLQFKFLPNEIIFIGDAPTDYQGAVDAGVPFIARIAPSYNPFLGPQFKIKHSIAYLTQLEEALRNLKFV